MAMMAAAAPSGGSNRLHRGRGEGGRLRACPGPFRAGARALSGIRSTVSAAAWSPGHGGVTEAAAAAETAAPAETAGPAGDGTRP